MRPRLPLLLAGVAILAGMVGASGCGSTGGDRPEENATLVLDFTPNAVHAGIYSAVERGYDDAEGIRLRVREPSSSTDSVKLLLAGRADFAILDIHDLAIAREQGRDIVGIMALVQRPLAAVLAQPAVRTPRDLEGRRVGVAGLPSDRAVLRSIVAGAGGRPARVRKVTIGFNAVPSLLSRRVDAATAFWNVEGVALRRRRPGIREFRVDEFGAPPYPELVVCATRARLRESPGLARALVTALARGYQLTLQDPASSAADLLERVPGLRRELVRAELDAVSPAFASGARRYGELDAARLGEWAKWEARFGIVDRPPDVSRAFDPQFLP